MKKVACIVFSIFCIFNSGWGQTKALLTPEILASSFKQLKDFIALPNNARKEGETEANIAFLEKQFESRNFKSERLSHNKSVILVAHRQVKADLPTLLFYFHADGQPVEVAKWNQPDPYEIVLRSEDGNVLDWKNIFDKPKPDWRLYGRSTSDDKGPIIMLFSAIDALAAAGQNLAFNLKVLIDFEEESGSPNIDLIIKKHAESLATDGVVVFDGPMHFSNRPTIAYGSRGIAGISLKLFGPKKPLHSGHYGNYVPNPAFKLARLLASMKDDEGKVLIPGLNDKVIISQADRNIMDKVPDDENSIRQKIGIAQSYTDYQAALQYSSFDIVGFSSGWVGEQRRTIIPSDATAELSIRLVPQTDIATFIANVKAHIVNQGYHVVKQEPTELERSKYENIIAFKSTISHNYSSWQTKLEAPISLWLKRAIKTVSDEEPVQIRMMGGSLPIAPLKSELKVDMLIMPLVNADNNQHSPNENIRVGHYIDGIHYMIGILSTPF